LGLGLWRGVTRTSLSDAVSSATTDLPLSIQPPRGQIEGSRRVPEAGAGAYGAAHRGSKVGVSEDGGGARSRLGSGGGGREVSDGETREGRAGRRSRGG
jgi:hypothetical protein